MQLLIADMMWRHLPVAAKWICRLGGRNVYMAECGLARPAGNLPCKYYTAISHLSSQHKAVHSSQLYCLIFISFHISVLNCTQTYYCMYAVTQVQSSLLSCSAQHPSRKPRYDTWVHCINSFVDLTDTQGRGQHKHDFDWHRKYFSKNKNNQKCWSHTRITV